VFPALRYLPKAKDLLYVIFTPHISYPFILIGCQFHIRSPGFLLLLGKVLKGPSWKEAFANAAADLTNLQDKLRFSLDIHLHLITQKMDRKLDTIQAGVADIQKMFVNLFDVPQSEEEEALVDFVKNNGGLEEIKGNDEVLEKLLQRINESGQPKENLKDRKDTRKIAQSHDAKDLKELEAFKKDLNKEVLSIIEENARVFDQKFETFGKNLEIMIQQEGDRILAGVLGSGPQKFIEEPVSGELNSHCPILNCAQTFRHIWGKMVGLWVLFFET
jgi:hypothetical protein